MKNTATSKKLIVLIWFLLPALTMAAIDTPTITVDPDTTNYYAGYTISSSISDDIYSLSAGVDSFIIIFDSSTVVPSSINPSQIAVNSNICTSVNVTGQRLSILSPVTLGGIFFNPTDFTIEINKEAGIRNPSTAGTDSLQAATTKTNDTELVTSTPYNIYASTSSISPASVIPNPSLADESAAYNIVFDVGLGGYLVGGSDKISIVFPSGTTVPAGALSGVTVNGTPATAIAIGDTVNVTTPNDVDNEGTVNINFALGSGLANPDTDSTYQVVIKTSNEQTFVNSNSYTISPTGELVILGINTKPDTVNQSGEFTFDFITGSSGALTAGSDSIFVIFPQNTYLPSDMSSAAVTLTSGGYIDNPGGLSILNSNSADDDTVALITPFNIGNESEVEISFSLSSGYMNVSEAGNYNLILYTSQESVPDTSNPYTLFSPSTTVSQVSATPEVTSISTASAYDISFNLGGKGRLFPGTSTITISFNSAYTISGTAADYDSVTITVAGGSPVDIPTSAISPNSTTNTITITVPSSVVTENSDNILITIDGSADPVTNPATAENYFLKVKTSVEKDNVNSSTYNIGGTAITINSVTLANPVVNDTSTYTFNITTQNALWDAIIPTFVPGDYIDITFPEGTILPSSISTANMSIDGTAPDVISVNTTSRLVRANVGAVVGAGLPFDVIIDGAANIINPTVPSTSFYSVVMSTNQDQTSVTSSAYTITGKDSLVSGVTVTPIPTVISADPAAYSIEFTTSSIGKLAGGQAAGSSTITLDFDAGTVVPSSIGAASVTVNSATSSSVSVPTSGAGGIVEIELPNGLSIGNNSTATVQFDTSAGLANGLGSGSHSVSVHTSSDTSDATGSFSLSATQALTVTQATLSPTTQNTTAGYTIKFTAGSSGALSIGDTIDIIFPTNTALPSAMSASEVLVNSTNPTVTPIISGQTLSILTPVAISSLGSVTILINQTAGIINPTLVQSYTLQISTDSESGPFTSPSYNITQTSSTISAADVSITDPGTSTATSYTVDFNVGSNGRLLAGTSTIVIRFGSTTGVSTTLANYDNSTISVNGGTAVSIASAVSVSSKDVTITVPASVSISNNDQVEIILDGLTTDPITNPGTENDYTLKVRTSVETTLITSNSYAISDVGAVTAVSSTPSNAMVNATTAYTVGFTTDGTSGGLTANSGTITITFPSNTLVPATMSTSNVQVNGTNAYAVNTNPATRSATVTTAVTISAGATATVVFGGAAGLQNPSISAGYTLQVKTSSQPVNGTSSTYTITDASSSVSNIQISVNPNVPSEIGEYTFNFLSGDYGRLVSGTSQIYILFPYDATFTLGAPTTSKVLVNSTAAAAVSLIEGASTDPDSLIITVPSSVTIGNNSAVSVVINQTSGIQNAAVATPLFYYIYTSVEPNQVGGEYALPVELTSFTSSSVEGAIQLKWITESEIQNAYWNVERCLVPEEYEKSVLETPQKVIDLELPFEKIKRIQGMGNNSQRTEYVMNDSSVAAGRVYAYQLTDVSYNGVMTRHNVIAQRVEAPDAFSLSQNYPNPFNPRTTIPFRLKTSAKVEIKIYDILGRIVTTLVNGPMEAGFYKKVWNGKNHLNQRVSSGVYFYLLTAKTASGEKLFHQVKKMMMLK